VSECIEALHFCIRAWAVTRMGRGSFKQLLLLNIAVGSLLCAYVISCSTHAACVTESEWWFGGATSKAACSVLGLAEPFNCCCCCCCCLHHFLQCVQGSNKACSDTPTFSSSSFAAMPVSVTYLAKRTDFTCFVVSSNAGGSTCSSSGLAIATRGYPPAAPPALDGETSSHMHSL
jgi:hypothetical protein